MNHLKQEVQLGARQLLLSNQLPKDQVLVIQQGFVKIFTHNAEGEERLLGIAGPGQALFTEQLFPALPALGQMETITSFYGCLIPVQLLQQGDGLKKESLCFLEQSMRFYQQSLQRMQHFTQASVIQRLALCICHVADMGGFNAKGELRVPLRRADWAALAHITTESAIRGLARMEGEGLLVKNGRMFRLLSLPQIQALSKQAS